MSSLLWYAAAGFLAQMVDGILGMGYGITSTSLLLTLGLPPAVTSASVHAAESVAGGASAIAHIRYRNVVWPVARRLLFPGIVGAVAGAWLVASVPAEPMRRVVAVYLIFLGIRMIVKQLLRSPAAPRALNYGALGFVGGFCDAFGGGWGPIVTASMLNAGDPPRTTIGSGSLAEFFVTVAVVATLGFQLPALDWRPVLGLAVGGVIAAPIAAKLAGRVPPRFLTVVVGLMVIVLSVRSL